MRKVLDVAVIQKRQRTFAKARDWEQFHNPKNLTMALAGETGELLEIFQWLEGKASFSVMKDFRKAQNVRDELADILYYIVRLADVLNIDLVSALDSKMKTNARKYPVKLSRGNAKKYTEFKNK